MNYYSIIVKETVPEKAALNKQVEIEAELSDNNGLIKDPELLASINMTGVASSEKGDISFELERIGNGKYKGSFVPANVGDYEVVVKAQSDRFGKESTISKIEVLTTLENGDITEQIFAFLRDNLMYILIGAGVLVVVVVIIVVVKNK